MNRQQQRGEVFLYFLKHIHDAATVVLEQFEEPPFLEFLVLFLSCCYVVLIRRAAAEERDYAEEFVTT
jgi:hypothetical protein